MANYKIPCIDMQFSLPTTTKEQQDLVDKAIDWALMHGMCLKSKSNFSKSMLQFAPFTLLPSAFPRKEFEKACDIQTVLNILVHRVAHNYTFLKETLQETIKVDNFTRKLFDIYETVYKEGFTQKISLGLFRSDLMLDTSCPEKNGYGKNMPYCCWKQVEINTIACGFGWLGPVSGQLHRFILQELGYKDQLNKLPENNALQDLCGAMIDAWKLYGNPQGIILFVVEDITYNICDQRFHEFEIRKHNSDIKVIRRSLTDISTTAKLGSNKELIVEDYIVSVVYYRCGYEPAQYHTEKEWDTRLLIERSLAIKCPSIQYHLAGTKKVQQALAKPGIIATFLQDKSDILNIKEIFTGLYALDFNEHGDAAIEMGIQNPERFVLKPQREGGCNNIYGMEIKDFLLSMKEKKERVAWILMDRIIPPVQLNYIIRPGENNKIVPKELVSELGIFGAIIADDKNIYVNKQAGHMFRTKLVTANEGGVATGLGACDSPLLVD